MEMLASKLQFHHLVQPADAQGPAGTWPSGAGLQANAMATRWASLPVAPTSDAGPTCAPVPQGPVQSLPRRKASPLNPATRCPAPHTETASATLRSGSQLSSALEETSSALAVHVRADGFSRRHTSNQILEFFPLGSGASSHGVLYPWHHHCHPLLRTSYPSSTTTIGQIPVGLSTLQGWN